MFSLLKSFRKTQRLQYNSILLINNYFKRNLRVKFFCNIKAAQIFSEKTPKSWISPKKLKSREISKEDTYS